MSYEIEIAKIDVQKGTVQVVGEGFPSQTIKFTEDDYWASIEDYEGKPILDINIWWDEQWGIQYSEPEQLKDGWWQTGSNYKNPEKIVFEDDDQTGFWDLPWTPKPIK